MFLLVVALRESISVPLRTQATFLFCNGGGFLSVKDAFSETGYPAFYR